LWSGVVRSGDFLFVNRWKWNFCHPKRGEIMVFSTSGINYLQQGTHYIKRMTGLPGDSIQIKAPNLIINGEAVMEPERIGQIARMEKIGDWAPAYAGFNPTMRYEYNMPGKTLVTESDIVLIPKGFYYAMGDNSFNSFDSRYWGPVPERNLLGPASVVHWPFTSPRWGWIK
jgi:signal peptidase I